MVTDATENKTHSIERLTSEERRRQLIEVALQLFSQKGFRGTTTRDIAHAAGINEAIIFRHFDTKEDLYAALLTGKSVEANVAQWREELRGYAERNDDERLFRSLAMKILQHHRDDPMFLRLMLFSALEGHPLAQRFGEQEARPVQEFLCAYVIRRQREGAFRAGDPAAAVRAFVGALIYHVLATELFGYEFQKISDQTAINNFVSLFLHGIRQTQAEADIDCASHKKQK
ncbi:MAG: TetR/AcrR family transcriptional regulator [Nitrospiraceae bacterium]